MMHRIVSGIKQRVSLWASRFASGTVFGRTPSNSILLEGIERAASTVVSVHGAVRARIEAISQVPFRLSDDRDNLIGGGDLYELLQRPNQWMDRVQYISQIEAYLTLFDECIIVKVADAPGGKPTELIPLSPTSLQKVYGIHKPTGLRVVAGWIHVDRFSGGMTKLTWDDVIPIIGANPDAPFSGLSALTAADRTIKQDVATREMNLGLAVNGGLTDIVLETEKTLDPDQRKEMLQSWEDNHKGYVNAHRTGLLWGGVTAKTLGLTPEQMLSIDSLRMTIRDVCITFRVVPAMLFIMEGETGLSQGSSTSSQKQSWWGQAGVGELARIAAAHQIYLIDKYDWSATEERGLTLMQRNARTQFLRAASVSPKRGGRKLTGWFDLNQIEELVEMRLKRTEIGARLISQGYLPDDINDYLDTGLPPHPVNIGMVPLGIQPVTDLVSQPRPADEPAPIKEETSGAPPAQSRLAALCDQLIERLEREPAAKYKAIRKKMDKLLAPLERATARKWSGFYVDQRGRVLERLKNLRSIPAGQTRAADDVVKNILPLDVENDEVVKKMSGLIMSHITEGWTSINAEAGIAEKDNPFTVDDPRVIEALAKRKIQCTEVNATTEEDLRKIIGDALADGATDIQLSDSIAAYYADNCIGDKAPRPLTAARTQVAGTVNDGRLAAAKAVKGLKKGWLHGGSADPRPGHLAAERKYLANPIGLDEKFEVDGVKMDAPGDPAVGPEHTANCTCMLVVMKGND